MAAAGLLPGPTEAAVFVAAVFVLNATPGVDFLLTVTRTLQGGARAGVAAALGISVGCAVHVSAAAFGLAALLAVHPEAFALIRWAGAGYLLWLAVGMLRRAWGGGTDGSPDGPAGVERHAWLAHFRAGLLTNLLNPKIALFFLAFFPQFVPPGSPSKTLSFLLMGAAALIQGLIFLLVLVALAARLSRLQASRTTARWLNATGGALFIGLALRLLGARPQAV